MRRTLFILFVCSLSGQAAAQSPKSCVRVVDDSNQFGTRMSVENRCGKPVRVAACARPQTGRPIEKTGSFGPWDGRTQWYIDFPAGSRVQYNVCWRDGPCEVPPPC